MDHKLYGKQPTQRPDSDYLKAACNALANGRWGEAWLLFNRMQKPEESAAAQYDMALCLMRAQEWDKAAQCLETAESLVLDRLPDGKPMQAQREPFLRLLQIENAQADWSPLLEEDLIESEYAILKIRLHRLRCAVETREWQKAAAQARKLEIYELPEALRLRGLIQEPVE